MNSTKARYTRQHRRPKPCRLRPWTMLQVLNQPVAPASLRLHRAQVVQTMTKTCPPNCWHRTSQGVEPIDSGSCPPPAKKPKHRKKRSHKKRSHTLVRDAAASIESQWTHWGTGVSRDPCEQESPAHYWSLAQDAGAHKDPHEQHQSPKYSATSHGDQRDYHGINVFL